MGTRLRGNDVTYFDISLPIRDGMLSWPSDPDVSLKSFKTVAEKGNNVTKLETGTHFGTHIDAPKHFSDEGIGVDKIPPQKLLGPVVVIDLTGISGNLILPEHLPASVPASRIIFKTANTTNDLLRKPFTEDYVALSGEAAEELAGAGVELVGVDYLSIQRRGDDKRAHTALLDQNIVIIEGLFLQNVPAGEYELIALPLRIKDGDGAPARVLLRTA